jgi:hypothetical protein
MLGMPSTANVIIGQDAPGLFFHGISEDASHVSAELLGALPRFSMWHDDRFHRERLVQVVFKAWDLDIVILSVKCEGKAG